MRENFRARPVAYAVAVLATGLSVLLRLALFRLLDNRSPFLTFLPVIAISAYLGGLRPGFLATLLGTVAANYFLFEPRDSIANHDIHDVYASGMFLLVGVAVSTWGEYRFRSARNVATAFADTPANAGTAVIATDTLARITYLNPVAEELTGWSLAEAGGQPLTLVFRVDGRQSGPLPESPESGQIRKDAQFGLAHDSTLLARDGRTTHVDFCSVPFLDQRGRSAGSVLVFRDATVRRQAAEADVLQRACYRIESALRGSNVGIWETEIPDGDFQHRRHRYCNVREQLGFDRLPSGQRDILERAHPDDRARVEAMMRSCLDGATDSPGTEFRLCHSDGTYRTMSARWTAMPDETGRMIRITGVLVDVSRLKEMEESLHASEQRFRTFVDHAADAFFLQGEDGRILDVNRRACESLGYSRDELIGMTSLGLVPDLGRDEAETCIHRARAGWSGTCETRHRRKDGTIFPVELRSQSFREGGRQFCLSLVRDITDRKRVEEALRESEQRFRGTFENAAVGIAHVDTTGRFVRVNEKYCTIVGYPRDELIRKTVPDVTHPDDLATSIPPLRALLRGESSGFELEKRYLRKDGSVVWIALSVALQRDAANRPAYSISVIKDISERKQLEAELRNAIVAAEAANRAKDEFLANVSHEIRTPMNAILGMTELALDSQLTDNQRQCLMTVKSAADNLLGIIDDLLDFAKIEAGKMELHAAEFSLRDSAGDTLRALAARAHRKGIELIQRVASDVPDRLVGDAGRLRQVLLNLVGNAIKFTDNGEVDVKVEVVASPVCADKNGEVILRFSVRDTGIGISKDKQERIFQAFEQEDTSTTRRYGGTGLGLTIAARLAALMGGAITVESEPGRGSIFTFTARFGRPARSAEPSSQQLPALFQDLPVLVVDDNTTTLHLLEEWLRDWRMQPASAGNAVTALCMLREAAARGRPFSLLLLDDRMPGADGFALAGDIRRYPELSATRVILLTTGDHTGGADRELRIDAHLFKPVLQEELFAAIQQVMTRCDTETLPANTSLGRTENLARPAPSALGLRVLVAEDNEFNALLLEQLLEKRGHRVRVANNGRKAVHLAETAPFDLLLLDIHMPEMDGFQVARALRAREQVTGGHLPVIALTARSRTEDREQCLAAGMDEFLVKPIQPDELWEAIDRVPGVRAAVNLSIANLLSPRILLAACGNDAAFLERLCHTFRNRLPGQVKDVRDALQDRHLLRLRDAAHKLSGMMAAFSTVAGNVASELEDFAARGRLDEARPLVARLESMAAELIRIAGGLSIEALRDRATNATDPVRTDRP